MTTPLKFCFFKIGRLYAYFALCAIFFLSSCSNGHIKKQQPPLEYSKNEKIWLSKFLTDVMLKESGIYTLWGSKPITLIQISFYSEDEIDQHYNTMTEAEKMEYTIVSDYDLDENWIKWETIKHRFLGNRFLFFHRDSISDGKIRNIYLVDLFTTALTIQENYSYFRNIIGFDFNPSEVVYEITQPNSQFWEIALKHSGLLGILFGYGPKNAWSFNWKFGNSISFLKNFQYPFSDTLIYENVSMSNFSIPIFAIFADQGPAEKFLKEKKEIRRIYSRGDFVDITLSKLSE